MSWSRLLRRAGKKLADSWQDYGGADSALMLSMAGFIEGAATRYAVDGGAQWAPGQPLKLLLAGYAGSRNTGADVRVEEMIRQFRHLLGDDWIDLSILTIDERATRGYFRTVKQVPFPKVFPRFVYDEVHKYHGVIACEGSMFKSKFANALSTLMVGALGTASAGNKLAVGYGGEAGTMDPALASLVERYCQDAHIIVRNENSKEILGGLGVPATVGTDTAWTFEPAPPAVAEAMLRKAGWDGHQPVLAICPINPFWWPVKPDLLKGALHAATGESDDSHYASVYFHRAGPEVDQAQDSYLSQIALAVNQFCQGREVFTVLVGMEKLDRLAAEALNHKLHQPAPLFVSDEFDMYEMVSLLRRCSYLVSSRYHAIVCSMPGSVPSVGITMDERIRNLMADRDQPELALEVDDPELAIKLKRSLEHLEANPALVRDRIETCVVRNLTTMGEMGMELVELIRAKHPEFPFRDELGIHGDPWDHLPPLSNPLHALIRRVRKAA
jgi:polysaccharide pyruvyl transferase WcaK-like protein